MVTMTDRRHDNEHGQPVGPADVGADAAARAVRPRSAGASAGAVSPKTAGRRDGKAGRRSLRLNGDARFHSASGAGRRGRPRSGEPDGVLWAQLTPRDRMVLELVAEHQVLTTEQLRALMFPSISRAQHRLLDLTDAGVLWRTQPYRAEGGSKPFHYLLGYRGAELRAARQGVQPPRPITHADRLRRILESPTLAHLLGVNQFFADLADYCRRSGLGSPFSGAGRLEGEGLHSWRSEKSITEFYERKVTPDGYGCWYQGGQWLGFFLEHDMGTEPLGRVADKLDRYTTSGDRAFDRFDTARQLGGMVLIWVASRRREQGVRKVLQAKHSPVPVATAARDCGDPDGPAGEVWSVVTAEPARSRRVRLGELPNMIGGTTETGAPIVLSELPASSAAPSFGSDRFRDGLTDEMGQANRQELVLDEVHTTEPDTVDDTPYPAPGRTTQPWWKPLG